jgi:hypothetical protein
MNRYEWPSAPGADALAPRGDDSHGRRRHNALRRTGLGAESALRQLREAEIAEAGARSAPSRAPATSDEFLWQPLGPSSLLGGQASGNPRVSGRVNALCVHPAGERLYAASANGGVWFSADGGAHWSSVGGLAATDTAGMVRPSQRNACGALHVLWRDPVADSEIVFLGTGEPGQSREGRPGDAEGGVGILVYDRSLPAAAGDPWKREAPNLVNDAVYRICSDEAGTSFIAATRTGLYQRPSPPLATDPWPRVAATPFSGAAVLRCSDALWTPAHDGRPARQWVWVETGLNSGLWVREIPVPDLGVPNNFARVTVDAANSGGLAFAAVRGVLAAIDKPTQVWLLIDLGNTPGLFRVTNPKTGAGAPMALGVTGVPDVLRDSGWYNIALAVDPSNENRVSVAGSYLGESSTPAERDLVTTEDGAKRGYDASIVIDSVVPDPGNAARLVYGTSPRASKMIGIGVHPDVHALAFSNAGRRLWTGCDGGVYRSDAMQQPDLSWRFGPAGFYARNHGLSISESNYIACSPLFEGDMMCGLQDNGTITRLSSHTWRVQLVGDGGGVVMDPNAPERWLAQYTNGVWSSPAQSWSAGPLYRGRSAEPESKRAAFYSTPAVIGHVRGLAPAPAVPIAQFLIGTRRLWYTDDFGTTWCTLPTATDPLPAVVPAPPPAPAVAPLLNRAQDSLHEVIHMCRWQDPDTAWVLSETALHRYTRTPGSHHAGGPGTWAPRQTVLTKSPPPVPPWGGKAKNAPPPPADPLKSLREAETWTEIEPNLLPAGSAVYLGTTGHPDKPEVDTLWWFDGVSEWVSTTLRSRGNAGSPLPAPVTSLLVDPERPDEVWVGTTVGVLRGVRTRVAAPAPGHWQWDWQRFVNGLPEATVEDLSLFKSGAPDNLRLLRAGIASRGVWELRLDSAAVPALSYLRVHGGDLRHRPVSPVARPDGARRSWHASPDIRPRLAPSAALAAPGTLPWERSPFNGDTALLRRFQSALRKAKSDPRIVANGLWDAYFSEVLRDHGAPTKVVAPPAPAAGEPVLPNQNRVFINPKFWTDHATAANLSADPWSGGTASEADLHEVTAGLPEGLETQVACELPAKPWKVDIVVHHRGREPRPGGDARVTLLWWVDPAKKKKAVFSDPSTWAPGNVPWATKVQAMLNSADGASQPLSGGWNYAGSTNATRRQTLGGQLLDPLNPGIASFDLNLAGLKPDTVVLLVAVLRAGADIVIDDLFLRGLTLGNPGVAVRAVRIK